MENIMILFLTIAVSIIFVYLVYVEGRVSRAHKRLENTHSRLMAIRLYLVHNSAFRDDYSSDDINVARLTQLADRLRKDVKEGITALHPAAVMSVAEIIDECIGRVEKPKPKGTS